MAEATEDPDLKALEVYLNTLVPNMRTKLFDRYRANLLFPRLRDRLKLSSEDGESIPHLQCECKVHDVVGPRGLSLSRWHEILGTVTQL